MYRKPYLFLFQTKPCDYPYPISALNCFPRGSSMCPGNLIPTSDQNMWFSLPYNYQNWTAFLEGPACVLETLFPFQIKICDFPYPISELNCCPLESSMCPGNLIPTSDQNMWFSLPYIRTELLSSRVQNVSWKPYSYLRSKYVIFPRVQHVSREPYPYFRPTYMYARKYPT